MSVSNIAVKKKWIIRLNQGNTYSSNFSTGLSCIANSSMTIQQMKSDQPPLSTIRLNLYTLNKAMFALLVDAGIEAAQLFYVI
ncbi:hypothetical protein KEF85_02760 [Methylomonas paludis]|uniref:Uncharacterized protein n=1 Tax=Methylomonas paludis TaxID=1173101 RepID=A0A975MQ48_9GAMM|nr:hypothetical protein [Methylomonas paludis]QWF71424.1 hypothetical protein KEF85_02760 [Methylomonas paludis]